MTRAPIVAEALYTPAEAAAKWKVTPQTLGNWARAGRIPASAVVRVPGAQRRYKAAVIDAALPYDPPRRGRVPCHNCTEVRLSTSPPAAVCYRAPGRPSRPALPRQVPHREKWARVPRGDFADAWLTTRWHVRVCPSAGRPARDPCGTRPALPHGRPSPHITN
jgi:hypothetical protein